MKPKGAKAYSLHLDITNRPKSIKASLAFLASRGYKSLSVNGDGYGPPIKFLKGQEEWFVWPQVRSSWKGGTFPFPSIHVEVRKEMFLQDNPTTFIFTFNEDCSRVMITRGQTVLGCPIVEVNNKFVSQESFYSVPVEVARMYEVVPPDGDLSFQMEL